MFPAQAQTRPISRTTFGGLTLLLVVAMACQVGGVALPGAGAGCGAGHRVVQELPTLAQAQICRRAERVDRRTPAEAAAAVRARSRMARAAVAGRGALVVGPVRGPLFAELDLPPPAVA